MKTTIFAIALSLSQIALSQTIKKSCIDNGGASVSNTNIQMVYTIGEVNVQEITVGDIGLSEGFIGPNLLSSGIYIPDANFEQALIDLGIDSDGTINKQIFRSDAEGVVSLDVSDPENNATLPNVSGKIADLTGIEAFTELTSLICSNNLLPSIDITQNIHLTDLRCDNNELSELDVSANTELTLLWCFQNSIEELNVTENIALIYLICQRNQLSDLDVSILPELYSLSCGNNLITVIDVSMNLALQYLAVNDLPLTKGLDFSTNPLLKTLYCDNSGLTQLDFTANSVLWDVTCRDNLISILDISNNPILVGLRCSDNPLTELNLQNGNNFNMTLKATNTNLSCINVDDETADHSSWDIDPGVILSNDCGYNTQRGDDVPVVLKAELISGGVKEVTVKTTYDIVKLSGNTDLYVGDAGPILPDGFVGDDPLSYLNIETTAEYEGYIEIAFDYSWMTFTNEAALRLLHYENEEWVDVTTTLDLVNHIIYGEVNLLSPFVIVQDIQAPVFAEMQDIIVNNDPGEVGATVQFTIPLATDNSSEVTTEQTDNTGLTSGSFFPLGITSLSYQATDGAGNTATCSFTVTVNNPAPLIDKIIAPVAPIPLGKNAVVEVFFIDNNLTEATIDWGDGSVIVFGDFSTQPIIWNYIYSVPGVYPVTIRLKDMGGEVTEEIYRYIVVYDPTEGFVTGGGWIYSLPGAYYSDPLLEGTANFGFISKYKKGSTVPVGNTEFQFKTGNLNFKSTVYEWLVIAGSKAMFKGSGTINGFGNYGFMLSAIDADLTPSVIIDKFRIKIWDKDNNVVYDNNIDVEENADPTTEIGGGSIVIHKSKTKSAPIESNISTLVKEANLLVYPNPFNERLQFEFVSPDNVHATIDIFDVTGRKVKTVFNGTVEGNVNYRAEFVPVSEVSNFYFYQMKLGEEVFYGKVVYNKR